MCCVLPWEFQATLKMTKGDVELVLCRLGLMLAQGSSFLIFFALEEVISFSKKRKDSHTQRQGKAVSDPRVFLEVHITEEANLFSSQAFTPRVSHWKEKEIDRVRP